MTMADTEDDLNGLDALFAEARQNRPEMPDNLTARILADAASVQAAHQGAMAVQRGPMGQAPRAAALRLWHQFWRAVGGWPAMAGMATACGAGLWIGLAPPDFVPDPIEIVQASAQTESLPYESYDLAVLLDEDIE
ncbi:hypothetical protein [Phycobacter sp. K97]|jgi:hypothetical protein|uniref:hypothetical protein n=1 Tax=Phycobacter sedimenti TaxID=3133977 RepID=UPI00311FB16D